MYSFTKEDTGEYKWEYWHKNEIIKNIKTHFSKNRQTRHKMKRTKSKFHQWETKDKQYILDDEI